MVEADPGQPKVTEEVTGWMEPWVLAVGVACAETAKVLPVMDGAGVLAWVVTSGLLFSSHSEAPRWVA